jgi:Fe2+ transport system protein FeoA
MTTKLSTCSMCGYQFDPAAQVSCPTCPVQKGCSLVCCPNCGYENVNIQRSIIARFAARFLPKENARVINFSHSITTDRKAHLQAYGIIPGNSVRVVQHSPVTVIQVDHTELALENSLARMVQVELIESSRK